MMRGVIILLAIILSWVTLLGCAKQADDQTVKLINEKEIVELESVVEETSEEADEDQEVREHSVLQEDFVFVPIEKTIEQLKKERNELQKLYYTVYGDYTKEEYEELNSCKLLILDDYPYPFEPIFIDEADFEGEELEIVKVINGFFKASLKGDVDEMSYYTHLSSPLRNENFMRQRDIATVELVRYETGYEIPEWFFDEELKLVYIATRDRELDCTKEQLYYLRLEDGMWKFFWLP